MNILKAAFGGVLIWFMGCAKEQLPPGTASLTVVHAVVGAEPLRTNFTGTSPIRYSLANAFLYGQFIPLRNRFNIPAGRSSLGLFRDSDTLAGSTPFLLFDLDLPVTSIHTLFLTGTVSTPGSSLVKDELPYYAAGDSTMGIRFINLSPSSTPISVNLMDKDLGSEAARLLFEDMTSFQRYAVKTHVADYVFEFRHAETGDLITQYTTPGIGNEGTNQAPNIWLYRNFTLALIGAPDGIGVDALQVLRVSHSGN